MSSVCCAGGKIDAVCYLQQVAWKHMHQMGPQELANTLYASASLGLVLPQDAFLDVAHHQLIVLSRQFEPQALANILWALGRMKLCPHPTVQRVLLAASYRQMSEFTPQAGLGGAHLQAEGA